MLKLVGMNEGGFSFVANCWALLTLLLKRIRKFPWNLYECREKEKLLSSVILYFRLRFIMWDNLLRVVWSVDLINFQKSYFRLWAWKIQLKMVSFLCYFQRTSGMIQNRYISSVERHQQWRKIPEIFQPNYKHTHISKGTTEMSKENISINIFVMQSHNEPAHIFA